MRYLKIGGEECIYSDPPEKEENEPITTPGEMRWQPCPNCYWLHTQSASDQCHVCEGKGQLLMPVPRA